MNSAPPPAVHDIRPEDNRLGARAAWALAVVFLVLVSLPALLREASPDAVRGALAHVAAIHDGTAMSRIRAAEKQVNDGAWTKPVRRQVQTALYHAFREGNRKVLVGNDGWLFHRPGIRALTGRGPMIPHTHSVSKDHELKHWEGCVPVIKDFAAQLEERGIKLVLVPVPDKARLFRDETIVPPAIKRWDAWLQETSDALDRMETRWSGSPSLAWLEHVADGFEAILRRAKLAKPYESFEVSNPHADMKRLIYRYDIGALYDSERNASFHPDYKQLKDELEQEITFVSYPDPGFIEVQWSGSFLKSDTHWLPESALWMAMNARYAVTTAIENKQLSRNSEQAFVVNSDIIRSAVALLDAKQQKVDSTDHGDLSRSLDLSEALASRYVEKVSTQAAPPAVSDPTAEIVLLGDSNVNMYDDPGLPFHLPGAGFGSWLSAALGQPLHIIAINGGGATKVRQEFARLPDDVVRAKKLVIWVLAERDLFMDAAVAKENNVEWKRVTFNPHRSQPPPAVPESQALVAEVTLTAKSALQDVTRANYPDAVYVVTAAVDRIVTGEYADQEMQIVLWNFRGKEIQPGARYSVGQKLRVTLVPWLNQGSLTSTNLSDDFNRFDIPLLYAEQVELP